MIEITMTINREHLVGQIQAVRISPLGHPKDGQLCTYKLLCFGEHVDTFQFPYGCGISLSKKMCDLYVENKDKYHEESKYKRLNKAMNDRYVIGGKDEET
jgi:hypothetical protein